MGGKFSISTSFIASPIPTVEAIGFLAVALIGFVLFQIVSGVAKTGARKKRAQRAAIQAKNSAISQISAADNHLTDVELMVIAVASSVSEADIHELKTPINEAKRLLTSASVDLRNNSNSGNDPENGRLAEEDYT